MTSRAEERTVAAAGGVVWRPAADGRIEVAVVHRPRYDDWSLPKGKLDAGEHALAAAHREVVEETGLSVVAGRRGLTTRYPVDGVPKRVEYWLMRWVGGAFAPNEEVDELRWLPAGDAAQLCTHDHDRAVVAEAARSDVPREVTLLLVRHGRAGSRRDFDGPDELRPLDARGRRQAQLLAELLPVFGPGDVATAGLARCRDTVAPLAERLGRPLTELPELGEQQFSADPQRALDSALRLLTGSDVTVACSQGGVIPRLLQALGVHGHGVPGLAPPAAKGSVWALGGRPGQLVADYYRDLEPAPDPAPRQA